MRKIGLSVGVGLGVLLLAAAFLMTGTWEATAAPEVPGDARIRVAHLSPDAPAVDIWVDGVPAFTGVGFEDVTAYASLPPGNYLVQVEPADAGGSGPFVISETLPLTADGEYTVGAVGELGDMSLEPLVLADDNTLPAPGDAHVRFVHASPNAPAVDITLSDGTPLFTNIAFKESGAYLPVAAGSYDLEVRLAGTMTTVLPLDDVMLAEGTVYTVFATGYAGSTPALNAVLVEDAGQARVRVAHMSPDAPNVDVLVDGAVAFPDVMFEEVTDYATLPSDAYFVEVVQAGTSGPVVLSATLTLAPNQDYTVVAVGEAGAATLEPLVLEDNNAAPAPGNAHVRFVHASPDAPPVDITLPDGTPIFADIAYKEVGAYTPVPAGTYDLEVRVSGTMTTVLDLMDIPLEKGNVYTVFATGYAGEDTPSLNAVLVVDESWAYTFLPVIRQ